MDEYHVQRFDAGDVVFREGDTAAEAFLILNGSVSVTAATEAGHIPLGDYAEQEVFGEVAIVQGGRRNGTAMMRESGELIPIPAAIFNRQLEQAPPVIRSVIRSLASRLLAVTARLKPEQDRNLFYAMAHLLYQMNLALSVDKTNSMPHDRAMKTLTAVLARPSAEIEAVLHVFEELGLVGWTMAGKQRPYLVFHVQDGFLGRALHFYDETGGEPVTATPSAGQVQHG